MKKRRCVEITAIRRTAVVLSHQPGPDDRAPHQTRDATTRLRGLMPADAACSSEPALLIDILVKSEVAAGLDGERFGPNQPGNYTRLLSLGISLRSLEEEEQH
jgi:hypothetical protein